jgi:type I restriction-modification system DNA methylase subunit
MNFFQTSVLNKHLKAQDSTAIKAAYAKFATHFHNPAIQENIRNSKEEQYQGEFLIDLFVNVLGYTKNPAPAFNITTEYKNVKDSKKADGAIIINNIVKAVIELKGTETTDLNRIESQAFGYKVNQPECVYVITSNFEKLRFYIDNAIEHIEFNLFTLTEKDFELLWLCLAFVNIEKNIPKRIKDESVSQEDVITKSLYNDYSLFKRELHQNLVALNPDHDPLTLFKKSQKLLDRFLFLFFAEDRQLLPPNSVRLILDDWRDLQDREVEIALYTRFKKYFEYLNTGFKGKRYDVFAYNGGLFKTDELLDGLKIDDELLYRHTLKLSDYDFASEVDVNILGHIFENSLNELDEIKAQLEGQLVDKSKSKRKKDGVFYTPKYITKYIVDNTVGKLCTEKKAELELIEEEYTTDRKRTKKTIQPLFDKLTTYRNWLLQLTICDPACGSGAFLNQALDFLINEHRYIDELQAKLFGDAMVLSDFEKNILENNLFGVDLNEESVEIAKLSLWLRTAQPNRKLNDLNNNIKCGNSLIDDPAVAGDKAFYWQNEFPTVFEKGGFDVVIGNPPYVTRGISDELKKALNSKYVTAQYQLDLYVAFIEKGISLLNDISEISFIVPNSWLKNLMMSECRKFILKNLCIEEIIPSLGNVFPDASVDTMIFVGSKHRNIEKINISEFADSTIKFKHQINKERIISNEGFVFDVEVSEKILPIMAKMKIDTFNIESLFDINRGINPYDIYTGQAKEIIEQRAYHSNYKKDSTFVPELKGMHVSRYAYNWDNQHFISYGDWLAAPRDIKYFEGERIIFREILGKNLVSTLITEEFKIDRSLYIAKLLDDKRDFFNVKYILSILNSTLLAYYFRFSNNEFDNLFPKIRVAEFKKLPVKNIPLSEQQPFIQYVELILILSKQLQETSQKFQRSIQRKFNQEDLPGKLQNWYLLSYPEFITELAKKKVKLTLTEEAEWEAYFLQEAKQALALKSEIDKTDTEIDRIVYELYGLTAEEIKIVEAE